MNKLSFSCMWLIIYLSLMSWYSQFWGLQRKLYWRVYWMWQKKTAVKTVVKWNLPKLIEKTVLKFRLFYFSSGLIRLAFSHSLHKLMIATVSRTFLEYMLLNLIDWRILIDKIFFEWYWMILCMNANDCNFAIFI